MVRQVVLFARGRQDEREKLDLRSVLAEVHKLARDTFPQNIAVSAHVADPIWPVLGNATQLHQVLLNLCVNARDAMPEGGSLSLDLDITTLGPDDAAALSHGRPGDFVVLTVADTGTGIPPEVLPRIFDAFFTTKPVGKGRPMPSE